MICKFDLILMCDYIVFNPFFNNFFNKTDKNKMLNRTVILSLVFFFSFVSSLLVRTNGNLMEMLVISLIYSVSLVRIYHC